MERIMKDPKVTKLIEQFELQITELNKTWKDLQSEDCYIRLDQLGTATYESPKSLVITEITQHIKYKATN